MGFLAICKSSYMRMWWWRLVNKMLEKSELKDEGESGILKKIGGEERECQLIGTMPGALLDAKLLRDASLLRDSHIYAYDVVVAIDGVVGIFLAKPCKRQISRYSFGAGLDIISGKNTAV